MRKTEGFVQKSVRSMVRLFAPLIGLAGIGGVTRAGVRLADELETLATVANASAFEFQKLAVGAEQYNVNQEKLADIFKDTNDKVGDFLQNGAGPLKAFFENIAPQIGITADEFRNLSGPKALQLYFNGLQQANLTQAEMIFYLEEISSDASRLIPLLRDSGAEFERLGEKADAAGNIMSEKTIAKLNRTNDRMTRLKRTITVLWSEILVKLIPAIQIFTQTVGFLGDTLGTVISRVIAFGKSLGTVAVSAIRPAISAFAALGQTSAATMLALTGNLALAKESLKEAESEFAKVKDGIANIGSAMKAALSDINSNAEETKSTFLTSSKQRMNEIKSAIDELTGKADKEAERLRKERLKLEQEIRNARKGGGVGSVGGGNTKLQPDAAEKDSQEADKRTRGKLGGGLRFETKVGSGGEREKVFFQDGRKLGTAEQQAMRMQQFGTGQQIAGVPDAESKMQAKMSAGSKFVSSTK